MNVAKERNLSEELKKCGSCLQYKKVYIEMKIKETHENKTPMCSKMCFRRLFGKSIVVKLK